jgi:hypothetical protein
MSLIADGLFDINGRWGATGGHATHTCGVGQKKYVSW